MKILIVDDDDNRSSSLIKFLAEHNSLDHNQLTVATSISEAKLLLRNCYYDILILDVVLPVRPNERPAPYAGVELLSYLGRTSTMRKPEKIIGLTAYVNNMRIYNEAFAKYCWTVVEADLASGEWKEQIGAAIAYLQESHLARLNENISLHVLTVHGIRTFGKWQTRLEHLVQQRYKAVEFSSYKFGYFTLPAFCIPGIRDRQVKKLAHHLIDLFEKNVDQQFVIFCHSFGTYLVAHALRQLVADGRGLPVKLIVLSGSVLKQDYDWGFLMRSGDAKIINECADQDYVLWLSEAAVLGTGMAGKGGFMGLQGGRIMNRFFCGGHSSYFEGDDFMSKYWVPLLAVDHPVSSIDERQPNTFLHGFLEQFILLLGRTKKIIYIFIIGFVVVQGVYHFK